MSDPHPDPAPSSRHGIRTVPQRTTRQRTAILEQLSTQEEFLTAQQLHDRLRADGASVGLATVYRNLQSLVQAGQVDMLTSDDGEALYRQCDAEEHHHHLVCRSCGRTVEFEAPQVEAWVREIAAEHGYTALDHTMEVFGLCPEHREGAGTASESAVDAPADEQRTFR